MIWLRGIVCIILLTLTASKAHAPEPPPRAHHAIVFNGKGVVVAGGSTRMPRDKGPFFDDTWSWDGARWNRGASFEAVRSGHRLAYDSHGDRVVSFGGFDGRLQGTLLELKGGAWRPLASLDERPTAEHGWVYDSMRQRFLLFGGGGENGRLYEDTWEFDGAGWRLLASTGPSARQAHAMAYDSNRDRVVVFGGIGTGEPRLLGDTWEYDGQTWVQVSANGPTPRHSSGMAFDSRRGVMVLFGGMSDDGTYADTWTWNGRDWTIVADSGPPARGMGPLAYDSSRDRTVLFGGRTGPPYQDVADIWEWDGNRWLEATDKRALSGQPLARMTWRAPRNLRLRPRPTRNRLQSESGERQGD